VRGEQGFPVRLRFTKLGKVRFVSHRDVARALERAFRIEQLPLAFTLGFSPRPKVSFGLALGVGHESLSEYLDVELVETIDIETLPAALSAALPEGIDITGASLLASRAPALQEAVTAVEFRLDFADLPADALSVAVDRANALDELPVSTTRKGEPVVEDLRPALSKITVLAQDDGVPSVSVDAATQPRGLRPADLLDALRGLAGAPGRHGGDRVLRTHQWIERDGARLEPLDADRACADQPVHFDDKGTSNDRRHHTGGHGLRTDDSRAGAVADHSIGRRIA